MKSLQLSVEQERLIGKISIAHGFLEFSVFTALYHLPAIGDGAQSLIGGDNFEVLLAKYRKLAEYYFGNDPLFKEFEKIHENVSELNKEKTELFHSLWYLDETGNLFAWKFSNRKIHLTHWPGSKVDIEKMKTLPERMKDAAKKVFQFGLKCEKSETLFDKHLFDLIQMKPEKQRKKMRKPKRPTVTADPSVQEPPF